MRKGREMPTEYYCEDLKATFDTKILRWGSHKDCVVVGSSSKVHTSHYSCLGG
jgi:hypothetical protein